MSNYLSIRPRLNSSSLRINNSDGNSRNTDFGSKLGFGFGLEAEYVIPVNDYRWSLFIEPTYQSYSAQKTSAIDDGTNAQSVAEASYNSIELPFGARHYILLGNRSKIFVNGGVVFDITSETTIKVQRTDNPTVTTLESRSGLNFFFGVGYKFNNFTLESRFQTSRELLTEYFSWNSNYKSFSVILGYTLL